jgi:hypothetical protein
MPLLALTKNGSRMSNLCYNYKCKECFSRRRIPWICFKALCRQLREMEQILLIENAVKCGVN